MPFINTNMIEIQEKFCFNLKSLFLPTDSSKETIFKPTPTDTPGAGVDEIIEGGRIIAGGALCSKINRNRNRFIRIGPGKHRAWHKLFYKTLSRDFLSFLHSLDYS